MTKVATMPTAAPLPVRLLEYIQMRESTFTPEMQRFLREGCTTGYHPSDYALRVWESTLPEELRFAGERFPSSNANPLQWTLMAPLLAWNYQQVWHKSINLADILNHWARIQRDESRTKGMEFSEALLGGLAHLFDAFPKKVQMCLLDYWLEPTNDLWVVQRLFTSSAYFQSQTNARIWVNHLCTNAPKQGKGASPLKRWAANLQMGMAALQPSLHPQVIEAFLLKDLPAVEKIRAARCADPSAWVKLAPKLLPLLPNNEWTRYDLLPVRTPTRSLSAAACGKTHRELARLYAPNLTRTIDAVTTNEEWADPAMIRQLVKQTYAASSTSGIQAEQFDLPADMGRDLFG